MNFGSIDSGARSVHPSTATEFYPVGTPAPHGQHQKDRPLGTMSVRRRRSLRQLFAGLLSHHVGGVPVWPIRIALPDALLVLAVGGLGAPKRARHVACGAEGSRAGLDTQRVRGRDLLQVPAVAVGITE
jgi:hypothetical protein